MKRARSDSSWQTVKTSSNWSTARTNRSPSEIPATAVHRPHRVLAGTEDELAPVLAAGQHPARQRGQQARLYDRRLPAARRPDDAEHRRSDEPRHELRDQLLAPEEVRRVGDLERGQPLERAHHRLVLSVADPVDALACGFERLDVVRKLGLDRAQVGAARGGAPGDRADPSRGLAPRPVAGDLVHTARHAAAHVEQPLVRDAVGRVRGRVQEGDLAHGGEVERLEHDRLVSAEVRERLLVVAGHEDEDLAVGGCSQLLAQLGADLGGRLVGVVQHEQRRAVRLTGVGHRVEQRAAAAAGGQHRGATAVDGAGQLGGDPRLAAPATAGDREDGAAPGSGARPSASAARTSPSSRPTSGVAVRGSSSVGSSVGAGGSRAGSWRRIAACRSRSCARGSTPISSSSTRCASR